MSTFSERLRTAMSIANIKAIELSERTGISKAAISEYLSGNYEPKQQNTFRIAQALNVAPSYLMGVSEMDDHPTREYSIPQAESHVYQFVPYGVSAVDLEEIEAIKELPRVSVPDFMLGRYARNPNILLMPVNGDSMNNIIKNGAIIAVLRNVEPTSVADGAIVVIQNCGDYAVKRFFNDKPHQEYVFRPDSSDPSFREIRFSYENCDDLQLIGKVVMYNVTL